MSVILEKHSQKHAEKHENWAFQMWRQYLEEKLQLKEPVAGPGQLKQVREYLQLSTTEMARRMKISRAAYTRMEKNESCGAVRISDLKRACEAIGCEVQIEMKPKNGRTFAQNLWCQIIEGLLDHGRLKTCLPGQKYRVLFLLAHGRLNSPTFRRQLGWSERKRVKPMRYWNSP